MFCGEKKDGVGETLTLLCMFGVDAGGAEEEELLHSSLEGRVNDITLDHQVFIDKLCRVGVVGNDPTNLGCS